MHIVFVTREGEARVRGLFGLYVVQFWTSDGKWHFHRDLYLNLRTAIIDACAFELYTPEL